ncbi:MAG TPA: branched-chain amino acid ABC transporter permease [Candidatus Limnocylindria bacterium]|nr:branched-chain amino acid ABC transporter permease [Candidatus Limnocylindria bacterium]
MSEATAASTSGPGKATANAPDAALEQLLAPRADWRGVVRVGLLGGVVALYLCLVGIVPTFDPRALVAGIISLGDTAILGTGLAIGFLASLRSPDGPRRAIGAGALAGALAGAMLTLFVILGSIVDLRAVALHASPATYDILTFGLGVAGSWIPTVAMGLAGAVAGGIAVLPKRVREPIILGLMSLLVVGLFAGVIRTPMLASPLTSALGRFLFASEGLTVAGAIATLVAVVGGQALSRRLGVRQRVREMPETRRRRMRMPFLVLGVLFVLWLPQGVGSFFAQVVAVVTLYVLMGFGLNITLGLAGLLDLGFVAFFAVGAYTVGLLTATGEFGIAGWPFWAAIPFAVLLAMLFGAFLGLPILGIRGDYLAIATLGFGEIIRILAGSDLMKPLLGGPRGITSIPKPIEVSPDSFLAGPLQIYYIALACAVVVAFVAVRLRDSRLGRAWVAIREDEDVAEAMGINLVQTKLLAYMLGAAFAGLGGAIFATLLGAIISSSINLYVSINVAAIIIVGGMGSIPGVVLGSIFLIGVPELFREFSEYRFLFYGVALMAMMIYRPEGILPSGITKRELHASDAVQPAGPTAAPMTETGR